MASFAVPCPKSLSPNLQRQTLKMSFQGGLSLKSFGSSVVNPASFGVQRFNRKQFSVLKCQAKYNQFTLLKSPFSGTFYQSPAPNKPPFVKVGDMVEKGQDVCIIEIMKLTKEIKIIKAPQSGTVVQMLVEDGTVVFAGTPLLVIAREDNGARWSQKRVGSPSPNLIGEFASKDLLATEQSNLIHDPLLSPKQSSMIKYDP